MRKRKKIRFHTPSSPSPCAHIIYLFIFYSFTRWLLELAVNFVLRIEPTTADSTAPCPVSVCACVYWKTPWSQLTSTVSCVVVVFVLLSDDFVEKRTKQLNWVCTPSSETSDRTEQPGYRWGRVYALENNGDSVILHILVAALCEARQVVSIFRKFRTSLAWCRSKTLAKSRQLIERCAFVIGVLSASSIQKSTSIEFHLCGVQLCRAIVRRLISLNFLSTFIMYFRRCPKTGMSWSEQEMHIWKLKWHFQWIGVPCARCHSMCRTCTTLIARCSSHLFWIPFSLVAVVAEIGIQNKMNAMMVYVSHWLAVGTTSRASKMESLINDYDEI